MGSVQFQIVPCSSLYFFLRSIGPFQRSLCQLQDFSLSHLSLPKWFPLFILASSVCKSPQCLISALTLGGEGGHLFRLSSALLGEGGARQTSNTGMCGERSQCLGHTGSALLAACVLSRSGSSLLCRGTLQSGPWVACTSQV